MNELNAERSQLMPGAPEGRPQTEAEEALGIIPGTTVEEYMRDVGVVPASSKMPAAPVGRPQTEAEVALGIIPGTTVEEYMDDVGVVVPPKGVIPPVK